MSIKNIPESLILSAQKIIEDDVTEDAISMMDLPDEDEPEEELSGEVETVVINPEYKTFRTRLPY